MADRTSVRVGVLSRQVIEGSEERESRNEVSEGLLLLRRVFAKDNPPRKNSVALFNE